MNMPYLAYSSIDHAFYTLSKTVYKKHGLYCVSAPNFIKIGQTVADIWPFNCFQNGGRPPSWILEIQIF